MIILIIGNSIDTSSFIFLLKLKLKNKNNILQFVKLLNTADK